MTRSSVELFVLFIAGVLALRIGGRLLLHAIYTGLIERRLDGRSARFTGPLSAMLVGLLSALTGLLLVGAGSLLIAFVLFRIVPTSFSILRQDPPTTLAPAATVRPRPTSSIAAARGSGDTASRHGRRSLAGSPQAVRSAGATNACRRQLT